MTTESMSNHDAEARNRALWDEIAPVHLKAYKEVALLREGAEVLDETELREIGDVRDKTMLHLQCHIGTDSLAWARHDAIVRPLQHSCLVPLKDDPVHRLQGGLHGGEPVGVAGGRLDVDGVGAVQSV